MGRDRQADRGATLADDPAFSLAILDALEAHIAVLGPAGEIVAVNRAWRRFAQANGGPAGAYLGADYLAACAAAAGDESAAAAAREIRAMLESRHDGFSLEYPCPAPTEPRWFLLRCSASMIRGRRYLVVVHEDVTARKLAANALRESERTLQRVLETLPVGVWTMDRTGRIVHGNPAGIAIWRGARYVGPDRFGEYKGWWLATGEPIAPDEWAAARAIRLGETSLDEQIEIQCFDGSRKIILNSALPFTDENGAIAGAIIVNQDISERSRLESELAAANAELQRLLAEQTAQARTDFLTGIHSRRSFFDLAEHELASARRYHRPLALVLLDVDHFKSVNDRWGHAVGDELLRRVVDAAAGCLRDADVFARHGGDEFVVLLPQTSGAAAAVAAEHILSAVARLELPVDQGTIGVTVSAGVAELEPEDDAVDGMIRRADEALYAAKQAGRHRALRYAPQRPDP